MEATAVARVGAEPHPFRTAYMAGDFAAMRDAMTEDVVLNSPILSTPFRGRDEVLELFEVIHATMEDVHFTVDIAAEGVHFMSWRARVRGVDMEGADILHVDGDGRIREFTVFFRPLAGITVLASALGAGLARRRSRLRPLLVRPASRPLVTLSRIADRIAPRLVKR